MTTVAVVILFSGMDVVGNLLNGGEMFRRLWSIDVSLEWWAERYQYSSLTTMLFWVPNHALGGWLSVGLLLRGKSSTYGLLPMVFVSLVLWFPLTAAGLVPFVLWKFGTDIWSSRARSVLHPYTLVGALLVAIPVVSYVALDVGGIHKSVAPLTPVSLVRVLQLFFLEAGLVGLIAYALRPSASSCLALLVLLVLPIVSLGPANDLVMRASIPSLTVLAVTVCLALTATAATARAKRLRHMLLVLLCVGAVTPIQEIARSFVEPRWPAHTEVSLVGAMCGRYWHHYNAKLDESPGRYLLKAPHALPVGKITSETCEWVNGFFR